MVPLHVLGCRVHKSKRVKPMTNVGEKCKYQETIEAFLVSTNEILKDFAAKKRVELNSSSSFFFSKQLEVFFLRQLIKNEMQESGKRKFISLKKM